MLKLIRFLFFSEKKREWRRYSSKRIVRREENMVIRFIMSFLAALALNIRFDIPQDMNHLASESKMLNIFYNFQESLTGTMAAATMVFVLLCIIDRYLYKNKGKVHRTPVLFLICFCIAAVWVMGESFYRVNSLALLHM